jgi:recombination protein RecR
VETPADQLAIESSVAYRGSYFVLMGRVNPMNGVGPKELGVDRLIARAKAAGVREIVIATSYTAEGETTAHMLLTTLKKYVPDVRVTRLARGLPAGIEIEFTDAATISAAILDRQAKD